MELKFRCGHCHRKLEADATMTGTVLPCPNCGFDVTIPEAHVSPGVTLGGFRIEQRLGKGAMGEVFLATQLAVDRSVALKVLPGRVVADSAFVERFFQEVRMAASLEHPNIVTAYDAGQDHGYHYFAMAYVDGEALSQRLLREGAMPEKQALRICTKVARALSYAWDHGHVLHRDVKPSNIMVDPHGEPLIMDMGIAKSIAEESHLTATGIAMGTPHYMSPEQARGSNELDFRTDMYSLGATLYHLIGGQVPFTGNSAMEVVAKHMHDPLPPIRRLAPEASQSCEELLRRMMEKDRARRYPSWDACIADMDLVMHGKTPHSARAKVAREASQRLVTQRQYIGGSRGPEANGRYRWTDFSWVLPALAVLVVGLLLGIAVGSGLLSVLNQRKAHVGGEAARRGRVQHILPAAGRIEVGRPSRQAAGNDVSSALVPDAFDSEPYRPTVAADDLPDAEAPEPIPESQSPPEPPRRHTSALPGANTADARRQESERPASSPEAPSSETPDPAANTATDEGELQFDAILKRIGEELVAGRLKRAAGLWDRYRPSLEGAIPTRRLGAIDTTLVQVLGMEQRVLQSFREQTGKTIVIQINGRPRTCVVRRVTAHSVKLMEALEVGVIGRTVGLRDLTLDEKLRRLGPVSDADSALGHGLVQLWHGDRTTASETFSRFGGPLLGAVEERLQVIALSEQEKQADEAFIDLLRATLPGDLPDDRGGLTDALRRRLTSARRRERIAEHLARYAERFGSTRIGQHRVAFLQEALRYPFHGSDWTLPELDMAFVWIPALDCWVGKYEVTNAQFRAYAAEHRSGSLYGLDLDGADVPAVSLSFSEAISFAEFVTAREREAGRLPHDTLYRLPRREEWTAFAACNDARPFPWGKTWPPAAEMNYNGSEWPGPANRRIQVHTDPFPGTAPVRISGANPLGLFGIGGNAWEWTGGADGHSPELRGNSWCGLGAKAPVPEDYLIEAAWARPDPAFKTHSTGFRLLLAPANDDVVQHRTAARR